MITSVPLHHTLLLHHHHQSSFFRSFLHHLLPPLPTTTSSALHILFLSLFTVPFVPLPFLFPFFIPLTLSLSKLSPNFISSTIISSLLYLSSIASSTPPPTPPPSTVSPLEPIGSPVRSKWWRFTMQWFRILLSLRHLFLQLICSNILKKDKYDSDDGFEEER
ncbi:PREDICTED: uncharacterized protein LOC109353078 [Lupinus angustifolius]|uniref:uncharacterized protein LOC109353078 n=1 Tax=Lupinus angustifolius TaxID=3871 RepID=UPI00092EAC6C|nr:PREDICTED: uncharacterized protein LOC109353078 [Lupinus angustifolius]